MKRMKHFCMAVVAIAAITLTACNNKKYHIEGEISQAQDSMLYFENMSLNGPVVVDSTKLDANGHFNFSGEAAQAPEFYRLRIAGQIINLAVDSTESITIKAAYPTMSRQYEVKGSDECKQIQTLSILQQNLQNRINAIAKNPNLGIDAVEDSVANVIENYKNNIKLNYIFKAPMRAYAYFALFQPVVLGNNELLIFNPRNNKEDNKVYAAVATSWDTFYPKAQRGVNLHNIAIQGMKDARILQAEQQPAQIDPNKVKVSGIIDIALPDNKGNIRRLSDLSGKVVMLDFHVFAGENSTRRIMMLRDLYNKYHAQGFEIYQVSVDPDEHFWKTQTAALPWISVRDEAGTESQTLNLYNVQSLPTFFLIGKDNAVKLRDVQVKDIDAAIKSLL
mgnify:FL=1